MTVATPSSELPLFPLRAVLFPGGQFGVKVFEARYIDLVGECLRRQQPFGVVALRTGSDQRQSSRAVTFEAVGTLASIVSADSEQPGILQVDCLGGERFRVIESRQRADGLWVATTEPIAADPVLAPAEALLATVRGLAEAIASLKAKGSEPFAAPYRFDDAGWVANRWCEILPISQTAKFKLMELPDPQVRLQLVHDFLQSKGVVA